MALSNEARIAALEKLTNDLVAGYYRQPTGPGTIRGKDIRPNTITADLINVDSLSAVNVNTGSLTISGTLTLGSGGKIIDADGSYWDQNGIVLATTGSSADTLAWTRSGFSPGAHIAGYITSTDILMNFYASETSGPRDAGVTRFATNSDSGTYVEPGVTSSGGQRTSLNIAANGNVILTSAGNQTFKADSTNRRVLFNGYIYPGYDNESNQTTFYLSWDNSGSRGRTNGAPLQTSHSIYPGTGGNFQTANYMWANSSGINMTVGGNTTSVSWTVTDDSFSTLFGVYGNGKIILPGTTTSALGAYQGKVLVRWNGGDYYIPVYA